MKQPEPWELTLQDWGARELAHLYARREQIENDPHSRKPRRARRAHALRYTRAATRKLDQIGWKIAFVQAALAKTPHWENAHEASVRAALKRGEPVRPEVLAEYPELATAYAVQI